MTRPLHFFNTAVLLLFFLFLPLHSHATTQTFSGPGTYNLSLSGINQITVSGSGGGGGGAGGAWDSNNSSPGNGGGGGAAAISNNVINIPNGNVSLTIVVGGGGQGGPANYNLGSWQTGTSGGATYLYVNGRLSLTLPGGGGSTWGSDYFNAGGSSGGSGGEAGGWGYRDCGGSGGKGGNSLFGTGGAATYGVAVSGNNGTGYGAGGSGASGGCNGNGGGPGGYGAPGFMTINYTPPPPPPPPPPPSPPSASLTISPSSVNYNDRPTLTWSSTNANNCIAGGPWSNSGTLSGSGLTDPLTSDTTFTLRCTGPGGTSPLQSVTVTVAPQTCSNGANNPPTCSTYDPCSNGANNPPSCSTFTPTVSISASPSTIDQGQSSTLTWSSTNATSCTGTGFTAGGTSGTRSTGALNTPGTSNYQVVCSGTGGNSPPAFASVEVRSPTATISASPTRVQTGTNSQISWSASQVNSCVISGPGLSSTSISGSQAVPISSQSIYTITCQTNGSPVTKSVTVNVVAIFKEF